VHRSNALLNNTLATDQAYQLALEQIVANLESGQDITPFLSRGLKHGYESPNSRKPSHLGGRRDLDLLLNDWGVHHLHLSTNLDSDNFVKRTKHVLFAVFRPSDAYLIDIMEHGDWTRDHILKVMIKDWPHAGLVHQLNGVVGLETPVYESDRKGIRNAGINTPFEFGGKVYMPAAGLTGAGTSVWITTAANRLFHAVASFRRQLTEDPE